MVRKDGAEVRKRRIQELSKRILAFLHKGGGRIPLGKTVSILAYESGLTKERIIEYSRILEDLDRFILDFEKDEIRKFSEEEETLNE